MRKPDHAYLEAARWPDGVRCPTCGCDKISKYTLKGKTRIVKDKETGELMTKTGPDRFMYQCMEQTCKLQFSTTVGTLFNDTHLPLNKWFTAIGIMCNAKKGASAKQIERDLDVSYKTAWVELPTHVRLIGLDRTREEPTPSSMALRMRWQRCYTRISKRVDSSAR